MITRLCVFVLIILLAISFSNADVALGIRLQPFIALEENSAFNNSGNINFGADALRAKILLTRSLPVLKLRSEIEIDFSDRTQKELLKDAWIKGVFPANIGFKAGYMKRAVVGHHRLSSQELHTIQRSQMALFSRKNIAQRGIGFSLFGAHLNDRISWDLTIGEASKYTVDGLRFKRLFDFPLGFFQIKPFSILDLQYGLCAPMFGTQLVDETVYSSRLYLQSLAIRVKPLENFELFLDFSTCGDSSTFEKVIPFMEDVSQLIHRSVYLEPSIHFTFDRKLSLYVTPALECYSVFEKGLFSLKSNSIRYDVVLASRLYYKKMLSLDIEWRNHFKKRFTSLHKNQVIVRLSYQDRFKFRSKKEK